MSSLRSMQAMAALFALAGGASAVGAQILPKEPIVSPTLYYGPPPVGFRVASTTPASASFTWGITSGAVSYQLMRTTGTGGSWTYLTPTPLPASTLSFTDNNGIDYRTTYIYRLQVNYSGTNPSGYTDLSVTLMAPFNPPGLTAKQTGEGAVTLSWTPVTGVSGYTVFGPGVPGGAMTVTNPSALTAGLANGTYSWSVASVYQPGNITSAASQFSTTSATVVKWVGTYRVTLLGFATMSTTVDDPRDSDGKGDEIIPTVYWQRFEDGTTPRLAESKWARGSIHGDASSRFKGRVRAGSGLPNGGIMNNDIVGSGFSTADLKLATNAVSTTTSTTGTTFPLVVWEGQLTRNLDVLVLYPVLWEGDESPSVFRAPYESAIGSRTANALSSPAIRSAADAPGISEVRGGLALQFPAHGVQYAADRPIGLEAVPGNTGGSDAAFFDRAIVLSMRKIEEALSSPSPNPNLPPGMMGLSYLDPGNIWGPTPDAFNFTGRYALYLKVERIR